MNPIQAYGAIPGVNPQEQQKTARKIKWGDGGNSAKTSSIPIPISVS